MINIQEDDGHVTPAMLAVPGTPFALWFSEIDWNACSNNRVKPLVRLDMRQWCVSSKNSRARVANNATSSLQSRNDPRGTH
jgi:hypothetical protein